MLKSASIGMLLMLTACGGDPDTDNEIFDLKLMTIGQQQIRDRMRDPDSATFTNVRVSRSAGLPAVCGEVNSRNGFGGMTGNQRFIAGGKAALEEEFAPGEFDKSWALLCR